MIRKNKVRGISRAMTRKIIRSGIAVATVMLIAFVFLLPNVSDASGIKRLHTGKDVKGMTFEEFWAKALGEATKWGGSRLMLRRVLSLNVVGFDGRDGRSPAWEAQFVRCDRPTQAPDDEENGSDNVSRACRGKTITLRLIETGVTGAETGLHISKEKQFRGTAIPLDTITVGPERAEDAANSYRRYDPVETDTYAYELKYDPRSDKPVWVIKRTCGYRGTAEGRCTQGDYWITKVDALSGNIIKR